MAINSKAARTSVRSKTLAAIKPRNKGGVKDIIDLANQSLTPIMPTSSGFPKLHRRRQL